MPDADKVIKGLIACTSESSEGDSWHNHEICPYVEDCVTKNVGIGMPVMFDALALLKEQENQKQNWLKQIADTQLLNSPCEWQSEDQRLYAKGVWDGLQIAWDIISEGR